jgi:aryl-alcohol dehydrogenase (NADP+)
VRAGSVRYVGASNFTAARLEEALTVSRRGDLAAYAVLQPHYNLLERTEIVSSERASIARGPFEGALQDLCVREGIGVVPYWALARGFLTGKYRPGDGQDDGPEFSDRARLHTPRVYLDERGVAVLSELDALAAAYDTNLAALALAWTVARPGISSALASARTLEQVSQLAEMSRLRLSGEDLAALTRASA